MRHCVVAVRRSLLPIDRVFGETICEKVASPVVFGRMTPLVEARRRANRCRPARRRVGQTARQGPAVQHAGDAMYSQHPIILAARAWSLALALAATASATVVFIEYSDHNGIGAFPDNGGPHWHGVVDTVADTLTIHTWVDLPGTPETWTPLWTPNLSTLPLVWPAVSSSGAPFDVPDSFMGDIDASWAFISPDSAANMEWNEGEWAPAVPEADFYPGWGGYRWPEMINGTLTFVYHTEADETAMPKLPAFPSGLIAASEGATVRASLSASLEGSAVPEASAFLFGGAAATAGMGLAFARLIGKRWCASSAKPQA